MRSGAVALAVELDQVSKRYALGDRGGLVPSRAAAQRAEELWALRDISLQVAPGESVGLIGHNGAGKTTLLRLLAGITRPTSGRVRTAGRIASLINLGAGFHPELTGRENVELNGVILGLSRREVRARFDAIVDFADLGSSIDTPLKRYSSGMVARLGFAVAAFVDPDVLLVDEVLSVGDVAFQDRSIRKMLSFRDSGQAVLFVSHNLSAVEMMCDRALWLDHGRIRQAGPTAEVVRAYLDAVDADLLERSDDAATRDGQAAVAISQVAVFDRNGQTRTDFEYGDALRVSVRCATRERLDGVQWTFTVRGDYGPLFSATSDGPGVWQPGTHEVECEFEELPLLPGLYRLEVELAYAGVPVWDHPRVTTPFRVVTELAEYGSESLVGATKSRGGFLAVGYEWRVRTAAGEQRLPGLRQPHTADAADRRGVQDSPPA